MKKALLIAEKPSLRRTIEGVYDKHKSEIPYEITFMEQRGHLLTLKMPGELDDSLKPWEWDTLPIQPEDYGGWRYNIINEKKVGKFLTAKERFHNIEKELKSGDYDFVIHAGDPDQEGELLVRIVLQALKNKLPVKRYWSNDTTEGKVLEALKNLRDDDNEDALKNLFSASLARQHSDWRVGMNISRATSLKLGSTIATGRVKTPIMSRVCQRAEEIANFKPVTVYGVKAEYTDGFSGQMFDTSVTESEDEDKKEEKDEKNDSSIIWFDRKEDAESVISGLSSPATVISYNSEKTMTYAPKLYKLATAQITGSKLGYNAGETLDIIQSLYEKGFVTYPRTDCEYLSSREDFSAMLKSASSVPALAGYIASIDSSMIEKVRNTKKWVNDAKLKESGHSALAPTAKKPVFETLTTEEQKVYDMICRRFVAIFMPPLVQFKKVLVTECGGKNFKSTGKTVVDKGYTVILGTKTDDVELPEYKVGDKLDVDRFSIAEKTSVCPKPYTDATLIAMCEAPHKYLEDKSLKALGKDLKIGTPATRASIIEELISDDKYLERRKEGKTVYIYPTEKGMQIYNSLKGMEICKIDMTGKWELKLEDIRAGRLDLKTFESQMMKDIGDMVKEIKDADMKPIAGGKGPKAVVGTCPKCGKDLLSGEKSIYCSGYKDGCKIGAFRKICDTSLKDEDLLTLINGKNIIAKITKGKTSWAQELTYDSKEGKINFVTAPKEETDYKCPNCGKNMTDEGAKYSCSGGCGFTFWKSCLGVKLSKVQIDSFFESGHTGVVKGMESQNPKKKGKKFDADILYDSEKNKTTFKFAD